MSVSFQGYGHPHCIHVHNSYCVKSLSSHPATTLIRRPDLALFVRHVTETGQLHRALLSRNAGSVTEVLEALSLCKNLTSFTWIDDYTESDLLRSFLAALRRLFVQDVTIRTHSELGDPVWSEIIRLGRLEKLSIWCMFGPSDLLQCSTVAFKDTLTHLEIGVSHFTDSCADRMCLVFHVVSGLIAITVVRSLPLLTDLRLKGAGTTTVSAIVSSLPNLQSLDSDYLTSRSGSWPSIDRLPSISGTSGTGRPMPNIRSLTIRPNSHILHNLGPWLLNSIVPSTGLESLKLHCLVRAQSQISLPSAFLVDLASKHRATLKHLVVGDIVLIPDEIQYICEEFPNLETLDCSVKLSDLVRRHRFPVPDTPYLISSPQ